MHEQSEPRDPADNAPEVFLADEQDLPVDGDRLVALARHGLAVERVPASAELSVLLIGEDQRSLRRQRLRDRRSFLPPDGG